MLLSLVNDNYSQLYGHFRGKYAPLNNLDFDSFLLICTSFVARTRGIVCVVYPLFGLANYKDPCERCVLAPFSSKMFWPFVRFLSN